MAKRRTVAKMTAEPVKESAPSRSYQLDVPVQLGTVSIDQDKAAISAKVSRSGKDGSVGINLQTAERFLCGARLDVALEADSDQLILDGMEPKPVTGIADVAGFSVKPKQISFRLKFPIEGFDYSRLSKLANLKAKFKATRVESDGVLGEFDDDQPELPYEEESNKAA